MTDRKFTPPTEFPAEYFSRAGDKAVIVGEIPDDEFPYIGYTLGSKPGEAFAQNWTRKGRVFEDDIKGHRGDDIFDAPPKKPWPHDDLAYTYADMEAAIKQALDAAAQFIDCTCVGRKTVLQCGHRNNHLRWEACNEANCGALEAAGIRAIDPEQFIEEPKG